MKNLDINLALMCGTDIPIPALQITLHQPTLKEISYIGDSDFFLGLQCLNINKLSFGWDKDLLEKTTNFQVFMMIMQEKETVDKRESVIKLCQLIFPKYILNFTPRAMILSTDDFSCTIDNDNFQVLQEVLVKVFCLNDSRMNDTSGTFNPGSDKAREIAEKLMRGRKRVAAQQGDSGKKYSALAQYMSVLTIGTNSMSLEDCSKLTIYQLFDLMERLTLYISWDIDLRSRLAGAKLDDKPENWMKNLH